MKRTKRPAIPDTEARMSALTIRLTLPSGAGLTLALRGREARNFRTLCATAGLSEEAAFRRMAVAGWEMAKRLPWPEASKPDGMIYLPRPEAEA